MALLFAGVTAAPSSAVAWSEPCSSASGAFNTNLFLGNGKSSTNMIGVYSEIEYIAKSLCVQSTPLKWSWSLSWISLDGPQSDATPGIDIYQGGYAKCAAPGASSGSCPFNNGATYYCVYYAHEQGNCGLAYNTGFINKGNATTGTHDFQISKVGTQWNFYIDEALKYTRTQTDITSCWPGVAAIEWQNEMLHTGDQGGGPLSNYQNYDANQYQTSTGVWHPANRPVLLDCDANSYPLHWNCLTDNATANQFRSADDRLP